MRSTLFEAARKRHPDWIPEDLNEPVFVDVNNVAKISRAATTNKSLWLELPSLTPPWDFCWLQYNSKAINLSPYGELGFAVTKMKITPQFKFDTLSWLESQSLRDLLHSAKTGQYFCTVTGFLMNDRGQVSREVKRMMFLLHKDGRFSDSLYLTSTYDTPEELEEDVPFFAHMMGPVMEAFALMNCKNISMVDNYPPPKVVKARERKGEPVITYKTLAISPIRAAPREGKGEPTGIKRSLHIRRGHYRTYTKEKPLFGKVTGTFYIEQHVAGHKEVGTVVKDYRVDVAN